MKKSIKIILIIVGMVFLSFLLLVGYGLFLGYQDIKWHENADNLGTVILGSDMFNEKLESCSPSYAGQYLGSSWKVQEIKNDNCIVIVTEPETEYVEGDAYPMKIRDKVYYCELSKEIYKNPENIVWSDMLKSEFCSN